MVVTKKREVSMWFWASGYLLPIDPSLWPKQPYFDFPAAVGAHEHPSTKIRSENAVRWLPLDPGSSVEAAS